MKKEGNPYNMQLLKQTTRNLNLKEINSFKLVKNNKKITDQILNLFPNGIEDLFNTKNPNDDEVYLILIFNCNENFVRKFYPKMKNSILENENFEMKNLNEKEKNSNENEKISNEKISNENFSNFNTNFNNFNTNFNNNFNDDENLFETLNESKISFKISENSLENSENLIFNQININFIMEKLHDTETYKKLLKLILSEMNKSNEELLDSIINKYSEINSEKLKKENENYYKIALKFYKEIQINFGNELEMIDFYYEFHYEDFIFLFCCVIKFFTGLNLKLEIDNNNRLVIFVFGEEKIYEKISEFFGIELLLKNYALEYEILTENKKISSENENFLGKIKNLFKNKKNDEKNENFINKNHLNFQFCDYSNEEINKFGFPPHFSYENSKKMKFQLYEKNDDYHNCFFNCEHEKISLFRNIEKLRIINKSLEFFIKFDFLKKNNILHKKIYKRNFLSYENKNLFYDLSFSLIKKRNLLNFINSIRNFFGEYYSFYFLFVEEFLIWMIFPSFFGILIKILIFPSENIETIKKVKFNYYDFTLILFCIGISLWATLFMKSWKKKEKIYKYFWGMENYEKNENILENFKPNLNFPFIFGEKIKTVTFLQKFIIKTISYGILTIMVYIRLISVHYIYKIKYKYYNNSLKNNIIFSSFSALILKIFSILYEIIARAFCNWENYEKKSQRNFGLGIKLIMFEFVNNYSSLFYIAFYKSYSNQKCLNENCYFELEIQLYLLLLINFSINLYEIFYPILMYFFNKKQKIIKFGSIQNQILLTNYETLIYDFNERIISFGFVCLFSVAAPLTPIFVLILTFFENFVDIYKFSNLVYVESISGADGIDIYNKVLKVFYFIGMLNSVALVLFSNPHLINTKGYESVNVFQMLKNNDFLAKFVIFAIVENLILVGMKIIDGDFLPFWFKNIEEFKSVYVKKFFNRENENLPHLMIKNNN